MSTLDSEGSPTYQAIDSISFKDFSLFEREGTFFLRIENPGRNSRELFNALELLFGFGFSADAITFGRSKPTLIFGSVDSSKLIGLKVSGAVVGEEVVARMEFVSKYGIDVANVTALKGLRYNVDFASFDMLHQGVKGNIAIFANGVVKIAGQLSPLLLDLLEQELPALISGS
ncbi:hypothetical protein RC54_18450 [Herbaspirillum rubrisubalbicans]|uniref:Uncharacterized protein n=1 Tax=Herbaspirillum rubrisubalbicans TaxID=80842 RepID=A0AAD0UEG9_9BURK|nr:hypothetical protein RC54_18450 [Herbaspirillum rubrisubalbicans]